MSFIKNTRENRNINKIIYITILMAILFGILFYLDMLSYFSLENIVSVILGFLILIIVQLRFISYYYEDMMKELNLDQVGVIKSLLKTNIFGEINSNYLAKKQKLKYYTQTKDQNDRLFSDDNKETFQCVMYTNISKNYVDNDRKIKRRVKLLKEKWELFVAKIDLFQTLLRSLLKIYKDRSLSFKKFHEKVSVLRTQDYQNWEVLFNNEILNSLTKQRENPKLQQSQGRNWLQLKKVLSQKQHSVESTMKQINGPLINEFNSFASQMRAQIRLVFTEVQSIQTESQTACKSLREVDEKIKASNSKIENLFKKISNKRKQAADMELIFNTQYDIKFLRIELSNLQVQQTYLKDMVQKNLQIQYRHCIRKQKILEETGVKKIQNKISHYLISYFDKFKSAPELKKQAINPTENYQVKNDKLLMRNFSDDTIKQATENLNQIQRRTAQFKSYLNDVRLLSDDEIRNLKKINDSIEDYNKQWKKRVELKNLHEIFNFQIAADTMFLACIESINKKQIEIVSKEVGLIDDQLYLIHSKELKKKNVVFKKISQKNNQASLSVAANSKSPHNIRQIMEFQIENKIPSCLQQIIMCFTCGYEKIKKEVEEKQIFVRSNTEGLITLENPQTSRMNEYNEYEPFKEEDLDNNDSKEQDDNSLALVNRILDVFAAEWCNSDNFHQILKEEIEVSLNTKRPPVLNYMNVKYIKLHRKQKQTIESLTVLNDNVFICNFEIMIKFKGEIAVHIETKIKNRNIPINIRLVVTEFECPLRICFTPFCLGKSNMCMMRTPKLTLDYNVNINNWQITKIPFLSSFIEMFIVVKLRKKFLYPKKATMKVPMAVKNALSEAIKERVNFEKLQEKKKKTQ